MGKPATIAECALELRLSRRQLQRYIADGAPQLRKGRRGRGGEALLDAAAIVGWLAVQARTADGQALLRVLASEVPELVAVQLHRQFVNSAGPHKKAVGRELQLIWGLLTAALLERIRRDVPDLPDAADVPDAIVQIARACRI
jgi:hypothetical protein